MNTKINLELSVNEFYKLFDCLKAELFKELDHCEELGDDPTDNERICELADIYGKMLHIQIIDEESF